MTVEEAREQIESASAELAHLEWSGDRLISDAERRQHRAEVVAEEDRMAAGIDRLILAVRAEMPCYYSVAVKGDFLLDATNLRMSLCAHLSERSRIRGAEHEDCPTCAARAKLQEAG